MKIVVASIYIVLAAIVWVMPSITAFRRLMKKRRSLNWLWMAIHPFGGIVLLIVSGRLKDRSEADLSYVHNERLGKLLASFIAGIVLLAGVGLVGTLKGYDFLSYCELCEESYRIVLNNPKVKFHLGEIVEPEMFDIPFGTTNMKVIGRGKILIAVKGRMGKAIVLINGKEVNSRWRVAAIHVKYHDGYAEYIAIE